jgi:NDP-sugar pyrophosphorylase family protein
VTEGSAGPIVQAVVLAGGRGTRLGELTAETPKPLLDVGGRPFIEWVLDNLVRQGVQRVVLTVGYRAEVFEHWLQGYGGPAQVTTFVEVEPLDTGGALALLVDCLDDRFFVVNGDTLLDAPLRETAALLDAADAGAAIALRAVSDTSRYGRVTLDATLVTSFAEKDVGGPGLINGGTYAFRREAIAGRLPPFSLERGVLPELVGAGRVRGLPCDGFFIDIGVPESYAAAQEEVPDWWARVVEG